MSTTNSDRTSFKTRDLSPFEYFSMLQLEFIVADLRSKIYPKLKDKDFWKKTREGKKQRIEDIAERNHLPSIFSDEDLRKDMDAKVYRPAGFPNFIYRDEEHCLKQEPYDYIYYYLQGSDVRFDFMDEIKTGIIVSYNNYEKKVTIRFNNSDVLETLPVARVSRII